ALQRPRPRWQRLRAAPGAGFRPVAPPPAGLALSRSDAAADAARSLAGARLVAQLAQLHRSSPSTRTRCRTLAIMPRVEAVSGSSETRSIRLSPSPISV